MAGAAIREPIAKRVVGGATHEYVCSPASEGVREYQ